MFVGTYKIIQKNTHASETTIAKVIKKLQKQQFLRYDNRKRELEKEFEEKNCNIEYEYKSKIRKLEKENNKLHKIIDKFYETIDKFIHWICVKFDIVEEDNLIRDFQKETNTFIELEKNKKGRKRNGMGFRNII